MLQLPARTGEGRGAVVESLPYLLESLVQSSNTVIVSGVPGEAVRAEDGYEMRATKCRSRFCNECAVVAGYVLRRRLVPVLQTFKHVMMLTLAVDPSLFANAEQAYTWVRERFALARLMQDLRRAGVVDSARYIYFLEFTKEGWPHWHVLVESEYVPHELIERCWGKNRPEGIEREAGRPPFGFVVFSAPKFASAEHAANYATKYVVKAPREGWPEWVLDYTGRVQRYSVSRGFWPVELGQERAKKSGLSRVVDTHGDSCFCDCCREGRNPETGKRRRVVPTVRERMSNCCRSSALVRVRREYDDGGNLVATRRQFVAFSWRRVGDYGGRFGREPVRGVLALGRSEVGDVLGELFGPAAEEVERSALPFPAPRCVRKWRQKRLIA
jgi:hypothetical protein